MAAGDVKQVGPTSTASGARLTVQPGASEEWVIHNVYAPAGVSITVEMFDGTNVIAFDTLTGALYDVRLHLTNSKYLRVLNNDASSQLLMADGVQTK